MCECTAFGVNKPDNVNVKFLDVSCSQYRRTGKGNPQRDIMNTNPAHN